MYRLILRMYPAQFRRVYGSQLEQILDEMLGAGHARGLAAIPFWSRVLIDTVIHATAQRFNTRRSRWRQLPPNTNRRLHDMLQDVGYAFRGLARQKGFAVAVILTLGLGIGTTTAIFSVINGVLIQPLPYQQDSQLMLLEHNREGSESASFSPIELEELRLKTAAFDELVEYHSLNFTLLDRGEPVRVRSGVVSWQFFQMLGILPAAGRLFVESDDVPDADAVLLLSYRFWQDQFDGDTTVVGQVVRMNDKAHTIVGVLPPFPHYPRDNDVYMPTVACPFRPGWVPRRQARGLQVFGRLKETVSTEQAELDLAAIGTDWRHDAAQFYPAEAGAHNIDPISLKTELTEGARPTLFALLGAVILVLLISCANVANLMWSRLFHRRRELALRSTLGATRWRLTRQLATESTVITLLGGALGLLIAFVGHGLLVDFVSQLTPRAGEVDIDLTVLGFTFVLSVGTGLLFGTVRPPHGRKGLSETLRDTGERAMSGGGVMRHVLVVSQIAISFMLLISAGLSIRSFARLAAVDAGVNDEGVLTMTLAAAFANGVEPLPFTESLIEEVSASPGVRSVALTSSFPLDEVTTPFSNGFIIAGREIQDSTRLSQADIRIVTPAYFETVGQSILRGRVFQASERGAESPPTAIINRSFAERFLADVEDPTGSRIRMPNGFPTDATIEVVGVATDTRQALDAEVRPEIILNKLQFPQAFNILLVRTTGDPMSFVEPIRTIVNRLAPDVPVTDVRTLNEVRSASISSPRTTTLLLSLFALFALVISATGTAGVIGFSVSRRTNEIGVRMALGADTDRVLLMFLRQGMWMLLMGMSIGVLGAVAFSQVLRNLLFGVTSTDPITYVLVAVVLTGVAVAATLIPARRAAAVNPIAALRSE
jgi:putative ABC transport system permease protein